MMCVVNAHAASDDLGPEPRRVVSGRTIVRPLSAFVNAETTRYCGEVLGHSQYLDDHFTLKIDRERVNRSTVSRRSRVRRFRLKPEPTSESCRGGLKARLYRDIGRVLHRAADATRESPRPLPRYARKCVRFRSFSMTCGVARHVL